MQKWEYLFVTASWEKGLLRPQYENHHELPGWKTGPAMDYYANQLGDQGWELVTATNSGEGKYEIYKYIFKRPKDERL